MPRRSMREAIVEKGAVVLGERGYNGAGIADITAAAGVPKGSFYNHFASKEAFAAEILANYFAGFTPLFEATLLNDELAGAERLRRLVDGFIAFMKAEDYRGCLMGGLALDASGESQAIATALNVNFQTWQSLLRQAIAAGQADGSLSAALSADDAASLLISAFEGAALRARALRGPQPLQEFKRAILATLLV